MGLPAVAPSVPDGTAAAPLAAIWGFSGLGGGFGAAVGPPLCRLASARAGRCIFAVRLVVHEVLDVGRQRLVLGYFGDDGLGGEQHTGH